MEPGDILNFSYAADTDPTLKRMLIRAIETMTGQPYLKSLYDEHRERPLPGESFWAAALRMLEVKLVYNQDALAHLPDVVLVPDSWTKDAFVGLGASSDKVVVTGHPHYDAVLARRCPVVAMFAELDPYATLAQVDDLAAPFEPLERAVDDLGAPPDLGAHRRHLARLDGARRDEGVRHDARLGATEGHRDARTARRRGLGASRDRHGQGEADDECEADTSGRVHHGADLQGRGADREAA